MIKIGQIDTRHQYRLKRNDNHNDGWQGSLLSDKKYSDTVITKNIQKPLNGDMRSQLSFKGFYNPFVGNILKPSIKLVPKNLQKKVFESLSRISDEQLESYVKIKNEFVDYIIKNESFRKRNGISDELLKQLQSKENDVLIYIPQKTVPVKFFNQLISPFTALYRSAEKLVLPKNSPLLQKRKEEERILKNYAAFEGLLKSHEIWENGYRKMTGHAKLTADSEFLIPNDVLDSKINRRRNKVVDPNKGKYSSNSLMIGNRLISGIIYSYFLGTDAYNTTMRYSNNKQEAAVQRKSRVAQEFSRIGMNMYIQNLLFGTFETAVNRSLSTAMFVSGSTVAFSEILGRKLVGRPIVPSTKEKLDKMEEEMYNKKGLLPSIGRLLTSVKKKEAVKSLNSNKVTGMFYDKTAANKALFSSFASGSADKASQKELSFKGSAPLEKIFKSDKVIDKELLKEIYHVVKQADSKKAEAVKETVMQAVKKARYFYKREDSGKVVKATVINDFEAAKSKKENVIKTPSSFEDLIENVEITSIPIGKQDTFLGKLVSSILVPVKFVKNIFKSLYSITRKAITAVTGTKNNPLQQEFENLKKATDAKSQKRLQKFMEFYKHRLELEAWAKSPFSDNEKLLKIFAEFKSIKNKHKEDIEGVKNILLWLDKQFAKEGITVKEGQTLTETQRKRVKEILMESVLKADGEKQLEYDGNTLAQTNINLSRAITTLFLVTDAYNLTMQYSNDNKKESAKSAKNRTAQEVSRIGVSAYIMAFVHNLLSKLCNSSLGGAFTLTAITSTINDSISREVVGVPLTAKSQEELEKLDKKNMESKSPIKKALAYSIGKKSALSAIKAPEKQSNQSYVHVKDFFITPEIH